MKTKKNYLKGLLIGLINYVEQKRKKTMLTPKHCGEKVRKIRLSKKFHCWVCHKVFEKKGNKIKEVKAIK